jgi:hypothetical protein
MRADIHDGPELRLHLEAEYIDAALTFVSPPTSSCDARPDHTNWHIEIVAHLDVGSPLVVDKISSGGEERILKSYTISILWLPLSAAKDEYC